VQFSKTKLFIQDDLDYKQNQLKKLKLLKQNNIMQARYLEIPNQSKQLFKSNEKEKMEKQKINVDENARN